MTNNNAPILIEFIRFLRNPRPFAHKEGLTSSFMLKVLGGFLVVFLVEIVAMSIIQLVVPLDDIPHALEGLLESGSFIMVYVLAVFIAPILEELIFRYPLGFFKRFTGVAFYLSTFLFAALHIFNFELEGTMWFYLPILVLPQFILGLYLGFVRLKSNVGGSILVHAYNNAIPMIFLLLAQLMGLENAL